MNFLLPLNTRKSLLRRSWPIGQDLALVKAVVLKDDEQALQNWREWSARVDIEEIDWQDHRMLAAFVGRLREIDPRYPKLKRLEGLSKSHWTTSQMIRRKTLVALDILLAANIPVMFFKGIAFEIAGYSKIPGRFSGDLDILVHRHDLKSALRLLHDNGWYVPGRPLSRVLQRLALRPGINLTHENGGDFDLHHQPLHDCYVSKSTLDSLWKNATKVLFLGREIMVPSLTDLLAISAAHGLRTPTDSKKPSSLWTIDFVNGLNTVKSDLKPLALSANKLGVQASVCAALLFTSEIIDAQAPSDHTSNYLKKHLPNLKLLKFAVKARPNNIVQNVTRKAYIATSRVLRRSPQSDFGP